jgi:ribosomal protein S18 acetylase RimI-like enzyme
VIRNLGILGIKRRVMPQATCGMCISIGLNSKATSNVSIILGNEETWGVPADRHINIAGEASVPTVGRPVGPTLISGLAIRLANESDIGGILACLRSAFEPYESSYTPAAYEDTVLTQKSLHVRLKAMSIFVAVTETGEIVGTIACQVLGKGEGHLRGMAVDPQWHGRGVAQGLLERAESELRTRKCERVTLDTTEYLKRAIHFYERNGYRTSGKVSDFFGMPIHEFFKDLT